jgi:hypothetical protein
VNDAKVDQLSVILLLDQQHRHGDITSSRRDVIVREGGFENPRADIVGPISIFDSVNFGVLDCRLVDCQRF